MGLIDILLCIAGGLLITLLTTGALWDSFVKIRQSRKAIGLYFLLILVQLLKPSHYVNLVLSVSCGFHRILQESESASESESTRAENKQRWWQIEITITLYFPGSDLMWIIKCFLVMGRTRA